MIDGLGDETKITSFDMFHPNCDDDLVKKVCPSLLESANYLLETYEDKLIWSWGRRSTAVAGEVTRHGRAHPYSWPITIVSLRSKESEE